MAAVAEVSAAWVREHVRTAQCRKDWASFIRDGRMVCPCEWGPCGWCKEGRHENCPYERSGVPVSWKQKNADFPLGWVGSIKGTAFDRAQVFDARVKHDGRCSCFRAGHGGRLPPVQLDIWDFIEEEVSGCPG